MDAYSALTRLRRETSINIAGGELNSQGLPEFRTMIDSGCLDWYQPDATFTGGIAETWAIIRYAELVQSGNTAGAERHKRAIREAPHSSVLAEILHIAAGNRAERYLDQDCLRAIRAHPEIESWLD